MVQVRYPALAQRATLLNKNHHGEFLNVDQLDE
jgi:hypothetical protein